MLRMVYTVIVRLSSVFFRHAPFTFARWRLYIMARAAARRVGEIQGRTLYGDRLFCNSADIIQRNVLLFGIWEPDLTRFVARHLKPGQTFVDVGANIGYFSLLAARLTGPTGRCVAIEASPKIHRMLERNIAANPHGNIRAVNMAAANRPKTVHVYLAPDGNIGATSTLEERASAGRETVAAAPLNDILDGAEKRTTGIVKIDVEGAELEVLEPILTRLDEFPDETIFVVEFSPGTLVDQGTSLAAQMRRLAALGLTAYVFEVNSPAYEHVYYRHDRAEYSLTAIDDLSDADIKVIEGRPFLDVVLSRQPLS